MISQPQLNHAANSETLLFRAMRWLKKPKAERNYRLRMRLRALNGLPFYFGKAKMANIFLAYHPDSYAASEAHGEFDALFEKFSRFNRQNNAGDIARLWSLILNLKQILSENVPGDFAELGVWRGNTAAVLAHFAARSNREVFLFDTFEGFNSNDIKGVDKNVRHAFADTSLDLVSQVIGEERSVCHFVKGYFPESLQETHRSRQFAAVSVDCDLYEPMKAGLQFFYPRLSHGGLLLLHDYSSLLWAGAKQAVDEFCAETNELLILMPDKSGSAFIRKAR